MTMRAGRLLSSLTSIAAAASLAAAVSAAHAASAPGLFASAKAKPAKAKAHGPARDSLAKQAGDYWDAVAAKRRIRNAKRRNNQPITLDDYVLTQPPPIVRRLPPRPPSERHIPRIPVLAEFLRAGAEQHGFVPDPPASEAAFK